MLFVNVPHPQQKPLKHMSDFSACVPAHVLTAEIEHHTANTIPHMPIPLFATAAIAARCHSPHLSSDKEPPPFSSVQSHQKATFRTLAVRLVSHAPRTQMYFFALVSNTCLYGSRTIRLAVLYSPRARKAAPWLIPVRAKNRKRTRKHWIERHYRALGVVDIGVGRQARLGRLMLSELS